MERELFLRLLLTSAADETTFSLKLWTRAALGGEPCENLADDVAVDQKRAKNTVRTENNKDLHEQKTTLRILKNTKLTLGFKVNVNVL